jgi:hypothetical protein
MFTIAKRSFAVIATLMFCFAHASSSQMISSATDRGKTPVDLGGRLSVVIQESDGASVSDVLFIPGLASSDKVFAQEASLLRTGHRVHLIQVAGFAGKPAGLNASGPLLGPIIEDLHSLHFIMFDQPNQFHHAVLMFLAPHPADGSAIR